MDTRLVYRAVCLFSPRISMVLNATTHGNGQAELIWVAGYIPRWFIRPQTSHTQVLTGLM